MNIEIPSEDLPEVEQYINGKFMFKNTNSISLVSPFLDANTSLDGFSMRSRTEQSNMLMQEGLKYLAAAKQVKMQENAKRSLTYLKNCAKMQVLTFSTETQLENFTMKEV